MPDKVKKILKGKVTMTKEKDDLSWKVTGYGEHSVTGYLEKKVEEERDGKTVSVTVRCYVDGAKNEILPVQEHIFKKDASLCLLDKNGKILATQKVKGNGFTVLNVQMPPSDLSKAIQDGWSYVPYALPENVNDSIHLLDQSMMIFPNDENKIYESGIFDENPLQQSVIIPEIPKEKESDKEEKDDTHSLCGTVADYTNRTKETNRFTVNIEWKTNEDGKIESMTLCKTGDTIHVPSDVSSTPNPDDLDFAKPEGKKETLGPDDCLFIQDTSKTPYTRKVTVALKDVAGFEKQGNGRLNVILRPGARLFDVRDNVIYPAINLENKSRFVFIDRERETSKKTEDKEWLQKMHDGKFEYMGGDKSTRNGEFSFQSGNTALKTTYYSGVLVSVTLNGKKFDMDDPNNKFFIKDHSFGDARDVIVDGTQVSSVYMRDGKILVGLDNKALLRVPEHGVKHYYFRKSKEASRELELTGVKRIEKLDKNQDPDRTIPGDWDEVAKQLANSNIVKLNYSTDLLGSMDLGQSNPPSQGFVSPSMNLKTKISTGKK